jgi:hypothetical protein
VVSFLPVNINNLADTFPFVILMSQQVDGFYLCSPDFSTNKIDRHDITEILLKVALSAITLTIIDIRITNGNVSARLLILTGRKETKEELQGINHLTLRG